MLKKNVQVQKRNSLILNHFEKAAYADGLFSFTPIFNESNCLSVGEECQAYYFCISLKRKITQNERY